MHSGLSSEFVTVRHEPVWQDWHGALQAPAQHLPSLQFPEMHCPDDPQA